MKKYICILASAALLVACEQKTETAAPAASPAETTENNTTVVNPPATTSETTTTVTTPAESTPMETMTPMFTLHQASATASSFAMPATISTRYIFTDTASK